MNAAAPKSESKPTGIAANPVNSESPNETSAADESALECGQLSRGVHVLFLILLSACCLVPIWATEYFPSQNGPWFLLPTQMFLKYDDATLGYSAYYVRNWHPIPHMLHDALVGLASLALPLLTAEKVVLSVNALLLPASIFALLGVIAPDRRFLGYLSFLMVLSYPFMRGYHDFTLSISLFFFTLAYWMRHRESVGLRQAAVLGLMAVLVYLSHLFTFALLAGVIGWIRLFETRSWKQAFIAALTVTWPGWILCADYFWINSQASWINREDTEWLPPHWAAEYFFRQFFHTVSEPAYYLALAGWAWAVYFVVRSWRASGSRIGATVRSVAVHPFGSLIVFLVIAYFLAPYKVIGWHKANVRLVPFILGLVLAAIAAIRGLSFSRRTLQAYTATVLVVTAAATAFVTPQIMRMDALLQDYVSGIEHFEPNSRLLPIHLENPAFGGIRPLTRAQEYYHLAKGGANGGSIPSMNTLSVMWYRLYPVEQEFPRYDPADPTCFDAIGAAYDYVLLMGEDSSVSEQILAVGFDEAHTNGLIKLYRNTRNASRTRSTVDNAGSRAIPAT